MVEVALFNINDIPLLFGGFLALMLACLLFFSQQLGHINKIYWQCLALFFFFGALRAFDTLVYWNVSVRDTLSMLSSNVFFLFGFVFFLQGPLLYWFTCASLKRNFSPRKFELLHLLPAACYPFYIYQIFHRLAPEQKMQYVHDWVHVAGDPYFEGLIWAQRIVLFVYSGFCFYQLYLYQRQQQAGHYHLNKTDKQWLRLLLGGFFAINCWVLIGLIETRFFQLLPPDVFGSVEGFALLVYVSALLIYFLKHSTEFACEEIEKSVDSAPSVEEPQQQLAEKLTDFMEQNKPYLEPHITVERLAIKLNVSPKLLSCTINSQLHMNFFELIGTYRVAEAKKRLADTELRQKPIGEIMKSCGFNSKSVFNQAFKKTVGVTPSHYRQQHLH